MGRLDLSGSPRLGGIDKQHVSALAQLAASMLPPVLVHLRTLRVIDGVHRVHAAILRGEATIAAELIDCDEAEAFVRAVQANASHGLPLSLEDRRAAGRRILETHPQWSDRMIARTVGLSPNTVGALRRRQADAAEASGHRVGLDGRVHRLSPGDTRRAALEALARNPAASVRELARTVGISVGRAHALRRELLDAKPHAGAPAEGTEAEATRTEPGGRVLPSALVRMLAADPSLRLNEQGRGLLRMLVTQTIEPAQWSNLVDVVPAHRAEIVIELAENFSETWSRFADELKRRSQFG
ncbi:winged helix-turn-helix transcriptional regulator [Actinospica durhamensis]|uniref:Winged helix-turn-helix transcriptional regulator n=1 Tax=Actinospica durhamensis TaxID=1508375 RepID=A0A941EXB7_9ACTN|nr:winged helix-turn-helix transcriptional regulator [Actinospica durhamensis]MBR7838113.1 winged helix-turn-helix transcriptional regulator [Actinospica durhamensis]